MSAFAPHPVYGDFALDPGLDTVGVELPVGTLSAFLIEPRRPGRATALLVPGYTGSKEDFRLLLPELAAAGVRALAITRRGQADSAAPDDPDAYALDEEAGDVAQVAALLAAASDDAAVHLLGHSLGGVIAARAAALAPERFASLTLLCSGPHGWAYRKLRERVLAGTEGNLAVWQSANPRWHGVPEEAMDADARFVRRRMLDTSARSIVGGAVILEDEHDLTEEVGGTGLPVLVAHGEHDDAWPTPWQRAMAEQLGARYAVIGDAFHSPGIEAPAATAALLADFWTAAQA
ncbi:alpha/beta fold hydrolase [Arenivirga flava]|uniref:Alpha/beta hydrolase n=1 Tax=Arenivirga flava TaxID=1930060 RepID=A0AA37XBQ7_9MICO|nr:alpha/beta fold hydrolase [Arenivirga flava]GMA27752.1 alpha/beta hydrolase [Arenivirga flava]